jgi:hypothetical protein
MAEPDIQAIQRTVLSAILSDRQLCSPWYQPWIRSEAQAHVAASALPLVYSWNEVIWDGQLRSLTVSVNGGRIAEMLECHLPRSHPAFAATRDRMTILLCETQNRMMLSLCAEFGAMPARLTARLSPSRAPDD